MAVEVETEERFPRSLPGILANCAGVVKNPVAQAIVERTDSPSAARKVAEDLGWPGMARQIKNLAHLRHGHGESWKACCQLEEGDHFTDAFCRWEPLDLALEVTMPTGNKIDASIAAEKVEVQSRMVMGDQEFDMRKMPLLLRELQATSPSGERYTTFDQYTTGHLDEPRSWSDDFWGPHSQVYLHSRATLTKKPGDQLKLSFSSCSHPFFGGLKVSFGGFSQVQADGQLAWYKQLIVTQSAPENAPDWPSLTHVVVTRRMDLHPGSGGHKGTVVLQRVIRTAPERAVVVRGAYYIAHKTSTSPWWVVDHTMEFGREPSLFIQCCAPDGIGMVRNPDYPVDTGEDERMRTALMMLERLNRSANQPHSYSGPDLESIVGATLLENPERDLWNVFVN